MPEDDTPGTFVAPVTDSPVTPSATHVSAGPAWVQALDDYLFEEPYLLLDADGRATTAARVRRDGTRAPLTFASALQASEALATHPSAAAVVGTLRPGTWGVDIDPTDPGTAADPVLGDAAAEALLAWATDHGLDQHVLRESGRPGGRHLIIDQVDADHLAALHTRAAELAAQLRINITVRRPLRLLQSPHRHGLPAPILSTTIRPTTTPKFPSQHPAVTETPTKRRPRPGRTVRNGGTGQGDISPSAREFGRALAQARRDATGPEAYAEALPCQVIERGGHQEWLRYIWSAAITLVAAERGYDEERAWQWLRAECPRRAEETGRAGWRPRWNAALAEAADVDRPRRYRLTAADDQHPADQGKHPRTTGRASTGRDVEAIRETLHTAAENHDTLLRARRPQVRRTMAAVIDALATAIAEGGRISLRRLAEAARVSGSTAEHRRRELLAAGLIRRAATFRDDGQPCDLYTLSPALQTALGKTRGRSCTPPRPTTQGTADPYKLRVRHVIARRAHRRPTLTPAQRQALATAYPDQRDHGPSIARSRARQRQWWASLTPDEQAERLRIVRERNDRMPADDRDRWFAWLAHRDELDQAIDRLLTATATATDRRAIDTAPHTIHHGRRDPHWRTGGTPPATKAPAAPSTAPAAQQPTPGRAPAAAQLAFDWPHSAPDRVVPGLRPPQPAHRRPRGRHRP